MKHAQESQSEEGRPGGGAGICPAGRRLAKRHPVLASAWSHGDRWMFRQADAFDRPLLPLSPPSPTPNHAAF
jgi:hypothetical protein